MMVHVLQEKGLYVHVTLILPVSTSMYLVVIFDSLFDEVICYEDEYLKPIILLPKVWARVHTGSPALEVNNTSVNLHQTLSPALLTLLTHYV